MDVLIVIPAYQPSLILVQLIRQLKDYRIIIVDDGSGEKYSEIFSCIESEMVKILSYKENKGKGHALKYAFRWIIQNCKDVEWVVTVDADGQHCFEDIVRIINKLDKHYGVIIGTRQFIGKVPIKSKIGNCLMRKFFWVMTSLSLQDTQSGMRAYRSNLLSSLCGVHGERYEYEMNCLIECAENNITISQVTIRTIYERNNETSHFRPIIDSARIGIHLLRYVLNRKIN